MTPGPHRGRATQFDHFIGELDTSKYANIGVQILLSFHSVKQLVV